jgi:hypothetical protein
MLSNSVANQLGISHIYTSSPDRWKWIKSTDTYSMYIFSEIDEQSPNIYQVFIKKVYPNNPENHQILWLFGHPCGQEMPISPVTKPVPLA